MGGTHDRSESREGMSRGNNYFVSYQPTKGRRLTSSVLEGNRSDMSGGTAFNRLHEISKFSNGKEMQAAQPDVGRT